MIVFLAEKPNLGQAIAKGLKISQRHDGYISNSDNSVIVTWCFGHILEQCPPEDYDEKYKKWSLENIPIIPSQWKLRVSSSCKKQFVIIKKLLQQADEIINAGDPDREGQLLVDEVINYVGCSSKPTKRILLNALDDSSVKKALSALEDNKKFIGLRNSALSRSRADWIIGMNLTRAYTLKLQQAGYSGVVNIGRVMTPTMSLVVRRENEIKNFVSKKYYQLAVVWNHKNGPIESTWDIPEDLPDLDTEGRLLNSRTAYMVLENVTNKNEATIKNIKKENKEESQPLPFSLSALQIAAGKRFGYDPQTVLDTMQSLYEKKLTSYPRSDCDYLPLSQFDESKIIISNLSKIDELSQFASHSDLSIKSKAWNDKKISAHHAIIPTLEKADLSKLSKEEKNLYLLVAKTYIAQFFQKHKYESTKIIIEVNHMIFRATGKTVISNGWKDIFAAEKQSPDEKENISLLPKVSSGDLVYFDSGKVFEKETKPPARYNPSSLLKAMKEIYKYVKNPELKDTMKECSGIGTEATRASIIEKLSKSGFFTTNKKQLIPTEKAIQLFNLLPEEITYPDATAIWENKLDLISRKELSIQDFMNYQNSTINEFINQAKTLKITNSTSAILCPSCGKPMQRKKSSKGFFWGCTGYPKCKTTASDVKGKPKFSKTKETSYESIV